MSLYALMASAPEPFCTVQEGKDWLVEARRGMAKHVNSWEKRNAKHGFLFSFCGCVVDPADLTPADDYIGGTAETHHSYWSGLVDLVVEFFDYMEVAVQKDLKRSRPILTRCGHESMARLMAEAKERRGY